jgi:hypothetical protein
MWLLTCAREVNESPIIIEYANEAKKHNAVIVTEIKTADFLLTSLPQASLKDLELLSLHTFPIELKEYAATNPNTAQIMPEGIRADGSSAKNATPLGNERTPAPIILFARLNVEDGIVA